MIGGFPLDLTSVLAPFGWAGATLVIAGLTALGARPRFISRRSCRGDRRRARRGHGRRLRARTAERLHRHRRPAEPGRESLDPRSRPCAAPLDAHDVSARALAAAVVADPGAR